MDEQTLSNIKSKSQWMRLLFMVLFAVINYFVRMIILLIAVVQFLLMILSGKPNQNLLKFGGSLSTFSYQIMLFLTYNSETKPFPFSDWPSSSS